MKKKIWPFQNLFPQMKVPSSVDDNIYNYIKNHPSKAQHSPKKSLFSKIMKLQYIGITAWLAIVAGVFMFWSLSSTVDTTTIDETIWEINQVLAYIDDDSQREFDDL